jgi:hypothetical protein
MQILAFQTKNSICSLQTSSNNQEEASSKEAVDIKDVMSGGKNQQPEIKRQRLQTWPLGQLLVQKPKQQLLKKQRPLAARYLRGWIQFHQRI